ncbi:MAG: ATP-dependent RecD-like DNA helicase [Dethiobacter sp.]|jgi:exodeoxyribonuclease V alpha subunit|nr:ATP-dependent RecD-like DNA helicase [Dethiobacter sp.]
MPTLEGTLERISFYNDKTLFMVARLRSDDDELCTIIGNMPLLSAGEKLRLQGEWSQHPDYGRQFKIQTYEVLMPRNLKGIRRFLASGLIKGVGPATAEKIVEHFGPATLDIIEREPLRLTEVEGIGEKKAAMIAESLKERREVMKVMSFLQGYGVGTGYATRIYRRYGDDTVARVTENPYRLAEDVFGVGFRTADKIALEMGLASDSPHRIRAALLYLLNQAQDEGHLYLPQQELADRVIEALGAADNCVDEEAIARQLGRLLGDGYLVLESLGGEDAVYLSHLFQAEKYVAERLRGLAAFQHTLPAGRGLPEADGIELAQGQRQAVAMALESGLLVVTGGPGTGKTTTIKALLTLFQQHGLEVMLAAPTGRAAKRMTEATGLEAKTIHRLLEFTYTEGEGYRFQRDDTRPLKAHVIIVDEVSMVDLLLFYHLLKAIPAGCRLILVGDMDQLPAVGAGNVLRDIIASGAVPAARLDRIFRQADSSTIITNAHRVNTGQMPFVEGNSSDFYFMPESEPGKVVEMILELCSRRLPRYRNRDPIDDIQVLSPMRRHILGVENLNLKLQQELNPPAPHKPEIQMGSAHFRLGDKVMQIRNNYQKEVFNGDIGRITYINSDDGEIHVLYPDVGGEREVIYDLTELDELVLSYAVSVHKSQGSEYPVVVLPVVTQHYIMLQRNLLYTAITRAKELVVLIGTKKALAIAVRNNKVEARYTRLAARLAEN